MFYNGGRVGFGQVRLEMFYLEFDNLPFQRECNQLKNGSGIIVNHIFHLLLHIFIG